MLDAPQDLESSFITLLEGNQNLVHKICRLYTQDIDAHQDLFQEITIQLWKSYPSFNGHSKFSTWAYRVALNTAISLYRGKKRAINTISLDRTFTNIKYEEYDSEQDEQVRLLYAAVHQLNDIEKALVYLYLEEKEYPEIAETLGISIGNARVKMNRIKQKLKVLYTKKIEAL